MCYALAVNWVPEKRSRSEQLGDIGDVAKLKIDNNNNVENYSVVTKEKLQYFEAEIRPAYVS